MATISRTGISNGGTIDASHITNIIDALDGTSTSATIIATGSFSGSLVGTATTASYVETAQTASYVASAVAATSATNAANISITNTTTGTGPYYPVFVTAASGNNVARVDNTTFTYNATSNTLTVTSSYALTASYAENAGGGGGEYMTLRLTADRTDTSANTYYVGVGTFANGGDRTGIRIPFDCDLVSASLYTNAIAGASSNTTSTITPTLYYNTTTTPAVGIAFTGCDLELFIDGDSGVVNKTVSAGSWLSLGVVENDISTCEYTITCDVLIKKV